MTPWVHLDADAFFASVEQAADARLRGIPMAVGGRKRGIIASASYEARACGVYTPMATKRALQICPDLVVVPGNYELYEQFSDWIFGACEDLTPWVERSSIDEGYLDFSHTGGICQNTLVKNIQSMDQELHRWLKITLSEGLAGNKLVSAVASKLRKPNGFVVIPSGSEGTFMASLPLRRLPGIGPRTADALQQIGARLIGDLLKLSPERLHPYFGRNTDTYLRMARGIDDRRLVQEKAPAKSFSQQHTFEQDVGDEECIIRRLKGMIDQQMTRIREVRKQVRTCSLKIRYADMAEAESTVSLTEPSDLEQDFYPHIKPMLTRLWQRRVHLRLVSLRFSKVYPIHEQTELFDQRRLKARKLASVIDQINETMGKNAVGRAYRLEGLLESEG